MKLPVDLLYGHHPWKNHYENYHDFVEKMKNNIEVIYEKAREKKLEANENQKKKIIIQTNPKLLYMFGLRWKLEPKEEVRDFIPTGPYIVLGAVSDLVYKVKKSKTKKPKYIHCDQIKILWSDR